MSYKEVIDELSVALWAPETGPEIRECVSRLFSDEFIQLVEITFDPRAATVAEGRYSLQPSDALIEVLAAVRANDCDKAIAIEHRLRQERKVGDSSMKP